MSVTDIKYQETFDALFSNAVLHWVIEKELAVKNIYNSLKFGGRFVCEFGAYQNMDSVVNAMITVFKENSQYGVFNNPWYFPTENEYKEILQDNGFKVVFIETKKRATPINDIKNWLDVFSNGILENLSMKNQENCKIQVRNILKEKIYTVKEGWVLDYVRLKVVAIKQ